MVEREDLVLRPIVRHGVAHGFTAGDDALDVVAGDATRIEVAHLIDIVAQFERRREAPRKHGEPRRALEMLISVFEIAARKIAKRQLRLRLAHLRRQLYRRLEMLARL